MQSSCHQPGDMSHIHHELRADFIRDFPEEPILVTGLEARLAQVFVNLITNAISFCEDGDAVRLWMRKPGTATMPTSSG